MMRAPEPWELYPMPTEQKAAIKSYIDRMIEQRLRPLQSQVESLREDRAGYREAYRLATEDLSRLDAWLRSRFPKQPREGIPTVDAALGLLEVVERAYRTGKVLIGEGET